MDAPAAERRPLLWILAAVAVIALFGAAIWAVRGWLGTKAPTAKQVVQEVRIIRPPPPPPKVEEPPPPPPEEKVDLPDPQKPDPTPSDEPPPSEQLGLDAEGAGAGDGFGLVGRKGGRDLLAGGGNAYSWYAGVVAGAIRDQLEKEPRTRGGPYSVPVRVWLTDSGVVQRIELARSSGDTERDRAIENALRRITRLQAPPADTPQPMTIRIVSKV